jgi:hypothetical protein
MARKKTRDEIRQAKAIYRDAVKQRKAAKKEAERQLKTKVKILRSYVPELRKVDLRKKITGKRKSKINATYDNFMTLTNRPVKVYKSRNKERLKEAQIYSQHKEDKNLYKFNAAFVPSTYPDEKIKFTKRGIELRSKFGRVVPVEFDLKALALNPSQEIARILAAYPDADNFMIKTGEFRYNGLLSRKIMEQKIVELMMRYSPGGKDFGKNGKQNHWNQWLVGIDVVDMPDRRAETWYQDTRKSEQQIRDERRKERNRLKAAMFRKLKNRSK